MARPQEYDVDTLSAQTLRAFWQGGYNATSMDDLVRATGVSRHSIYKAFGGKKGMFLQSFDLYQSAIVSPAFEQVETPNAGFDEIQAYFEHLIALAEQDGLPGPGCFVANSATEVAPHDVDVQLKIDEHNDRLRNGFASALANTSDKKNDQTIDLAADVTLVFATGLWSISRVTDDGDYLRRTVASFLDMLKGKLQ